DTKALAGRFQNAAPQVKGAIIRIFADRRAVENFDVVFNSISSTDTRVRKAAFAALPYLASAGNAKELLNLLTQTENDEEVKSIQAALIATINKENASLVNEAYGKSRTKVLPLLPYLNDGEALTKVKAALNSANDQEKEAAFA